MLRCLLTNSPRRSVLTFGELATSTTLCAGNEFRSSRFNIRMSVSQPLLVHTGSSVYRKTILKGGAIRRRLPLPSCPQMERYYLPLARETLLLNHSQGPGPEDSTEIDTRSAHARSTSLQARRSYLHGIEASNRTSLPHGQNSCGA